MALRLQPDATLLVVGHLKSSPDLQALVSQRVSAELPATPAWPRVQVVELTGAQVVRRQLRETVVDVASWGDNRSSASTVAQTVDAVLMEMSGVVDGHVVNHVRVLTPPVWRPDPDTGRARFVATYGVTVHP